MMILNSYRFGGAAPPAGLLLDDYPNAVAAYSLVKLRTAYTGAAIRVRESGGNTEADIGFSGNVLDTAALLAHCGGNDGFVTVWYEQSGNGYDCSQAITAFQPQIVASGSVRVLNGLPSVYFNGNHNILISGSKTTLKDIYQNEAAFFCVANRESTTLTRTILGNNLGGAATIGTLFSLQSNNNYEHYTTNGSANVVINIGNVGISGQNQFILMDMTDVQASTAADRSESYANAGSVIKNNTTTNAASTNISTNDFMIGSSGGTSNRWLGNMQLVLVYTTNMKANRVGIRDAINNMFNVY